MGEITNQRPSRRNGYKQADLLQAVRTGKDRLHDSEYHNGPLVPGAMTHSFSCRNHVLYASNHPSGVISASATGRDSK